MMPVVGGVEGGCLCQIALLGGFLGVRRSWVLPYEAKETWRKVSRGCWERLTW